MRQDRDAQHRARAERVYGWFLRLYPAAHRRAFGPEMLQTFGDHYRDAIETEGESELRFWLGVVGDEGKSIVREQVAALRERNASMKKLPLLALIVGCLLLVGLVVFLPRNPGFEFFGGPQGVIGLLGLLVTFLLLFGPIITCLLAIIARFVRTFPRPAMQPGWVRLGLVLGSLLSLYVVVSNVLSGLLPAPEMGSSIELMILPLLTGVIGVVAGYASGRGRTGIFAGLLAGAMGLVVSQASQVLLIMVLWSAIQHGGVPSSSLAADYQFYLQRTSGPMTLGKFLGLEFLEDGVGFIVITGLVILAGEGLFAALGGLIGVTALRQADDNQQQEALPHPRPVWFMFSMLALSLLVWAGAAEVQSLGGNHRLLSPEELSSSFASPAGLSWLLGFLAVIAFVFVSAWRTAARPEASTAGG